MPADRRRAEGRPAPARRDATRGQAEARQRATPKSWGSLARKGTRWLDEPGAGPATQAWRDAVAKAKDETPKDRPAWEPEVWIEDDEPVPARKAGTAKSAKATKASRPRHKLPREVVREVADEAGTPQAARVATRLAEASKAYERDRYRDALAMLKPLRDRNPGVAAVRELLGLTLYRLGRWQQAVKELEAFRELTGSYDQVPTQADCYRALKRWTKVDGLWDDLRQASPGAELMTEGRIVQAGALADRGRLPDAIDLLEKSRAHPKRPKEHHLRQWYALADLYERAGEIPRARELFRRVLAADPDLSDVAERVANLA